MVIESTRLGSLEIPEEKILKFANGLPGFPAETAFAIMPYGEDSPFAFLQSVSEPNLTFLVVEPFALFNDYEFELADEYAKELDLLGAVQPHILNVVTIPEKIEEMTANLLAPIIINPKSGKAAQVILENTPYTTSHRLFPNGFPKKADKEAK